MKTSDELLKAMEAADKAARESQSIDQIFGVRVGLPPISRALPKTQSNTASSR
jgi:hypothetical protein